MKQIFSVVLLILLIHGGTIQAQPAPRDAEGFSNGQIVLPGGATISASIRDQVRKKGEIIVIQEGKKTRYRAGDISEVQAGGVSYITNNYTFYEVVYTATGFSLLRKANQPSGVQYNGNDPIVITPGEGNVDDLFIKGTNETVIQLLTKKNISELLGKYCSSCIAAIDTKNFEAAAIKKAVEECSRCK